MRDGDGVPCKGCSMHLMKDPCLFAFIRHVDRMCRHSLPASPLQEVQPDGREKNASPANKGTFGIP